MKNLREWVDERGMTVSFLASKLGVSKPTVYNIMLRKPVCLEVAEAVERFTEGEVKPLVSHMMIIKKKKTGSYDRIHRIG